MMRAEIDKQHIKILYNTILLALATAMIAILAFFLYRQHKLNKQLTMALDKAEKANNVKNIFLKNISHEFRTPLNAVMGFSQILSDPDMPLDDESTRTMAGAIREGADKLTALIDNIVKVTDKLSTLDKLEDCQTILQKIDSD